MPSLNNRVQKLEGAATEDDVQLPDIHIYAHPIIDPETGHTIGVECSGQPIIVPAYRRPRR